MKGVRSILFSLTVGSAVLAPPWTYLDSGHIAAAYAYSTVRGTVTLVGVYAPGSNVVGGVQVNYARARVRINGDCDNGSDSDSIWIIISSGNLTSSGYLTEVYSVNMKNAYSTLLTALISGRPVEIDGIDSCSPNTRHELTLDLPNGDVSLFQ